MTAFTTSSGRSIPFVAGYRDAHLLVDAKAVFGGSARSVGLGIDGFVKDVYQYAMLLDFLESVGVGLRWKRTLDLGGAEGTMSRLLRGQGRAAHTTTVEIEDFRPALDTRRFMRLWSRLRALTALARHRDDVRRFLVSGTPWRGRRLSNHFEDFGWWPPAGSVFWRLGLSAPPRVDEYVVGDIYALGGTYDLVSAASVIAWFELDRLFSHVRSLLAPDGVFYIQTDYWWFPVNSTFLVGHFPYACQRLTPGDFERYVGEFHPEEREDMLTRYRYFHHGEHATVDDYVAIGRRAGFEFLGYRALRPRRHERGTEPPTPRFISAEDEMAQAAALDDIHTHRPDVRAADLGTSWVQLAFRRT